MSSSIDQRAIEWFVRIGSEDLSSGEYENFEAWLGVNRLHYRAYDRLCVLWNKIEKFSEKPEIKAFLADDCAED